MSTFFLPPAPALPTCEPALGADGLAAFPIANRCFREHQLAALQSAGLVEGDSGSVWRADPCAWLDAGEAASCVASGLSEMRDEEGRVLLSNVRGQGTASVKKSFAVRHPWDLLRANELALAAQKQFEQQVTVHASTYVDGRLSVGAGTKILPGVVIEGDVVIGAGCKVGPNCYIRGATSIGDRCHIGQAVEVKNSVILAGTSVGHLSYVGDSILCDGVNFGAGTIVSNLRHDGKSHRSDVFGVLVDTGRRKFGTVVGAGVHTGINTSVYPGRKLWPGTSTRPGEIVARDLHG